MEDADIAEQVRRLRGEVGRLRLLVAVGAAIGISAAASTGTSTDVLRAKGLIITDEQGRERILIGAPAPVVASRERTDVTTSIVFRGDNGADRLIVGEQPGPRINGRVYPRISAGYGMTLYNPAGDERGGMNFLDVGRGVITLDRPEGEAIALSTDETSGEAEISLFHPVRGGVQWKALMVATNRDAATATVVDARGRPRATLDWSTGQPAFTVLDIDLARE